MKRSKERGITIYTWSGVARVTYLTEELWQAQWWAYEDFRYTTSDFTTSHFSRMMTTARPKKKDEDKEKQG